jgi:hypothetical protein
MLESSLTVTFTRRAVPGTAATVTVGGVLSTSKGALSLSPLSETPDGLLGASLAVTLMT